MRGLSRRAVAGNAAAIVVATIVVVAAGVHFERSGHPATPPRPAGPASARPVHPALPPMPYLGVYEPASPGSYTDMAGFAGLIGRQPNIAVYYSSWWEPFQTGFAEAARRHGATPMVQIEPSAVSLSAVASGAYDSYLNSYAAAVRSFGSRVILAFGHEMNADWYGWGYGRTPPSVFVAAWRHIHDLFAADGARNVVWLWVVNSTGSPPVSSSLGQWWPGSRYVTWVGVDGHYFNPGVTFPKLFNSTLAELRSLTADPVLVSEAGIAPDVPLGRITDLFSGAQAHGLIGVVWFDVAGHNIRVEGYPSALSELRTAVDDYTRVPPT